MWKSERGEIQNGLRDGEAMIDLFKDGGGGKKDKNRGAVCLKERLGEKNAFP